MLSRRSSPHAARARLMRRAPPGQATLAYRSRAMTPLTDVAVQQQLAAARERNRAEGLTGLMVHEGGRFFEWLEGPEDALARVWQSVQHDPRHTAVELVGQAPTPLRFFGDRNTKLATRRIDAPSDTVIALRRQAETLARLLMAVDAVPAARLLQQACRRTSAAETLCRDLFEPAARHLGDLWQADDCSEFDVALGLGRLQTLWRGLAVETPRAAIADAPPVLVLPAPGEAHMIGAALHAEVLWRAGWDARVEFPQDDATLERLVARTWLGALDLSLSAAFQRDHRLARLTASIARARAASRNPALVVVVSGRVFIDHPEAGAQVRADAVCASAAQIEATLVRELAQVGAPAWATF